MDNRDEKVSYVKIYVLNPFEGFFRILDELVQPRLKYI